MFIDSSTVEWSLSIDTIDINRCAYLTKMLDCFDMASSCSKMKRRFSIGIASINIYFPDSSTADKVFVYLLTARSHALRHQFDPNGFPPGSAVLGRGTLPGSSILIEDRSKPLGRYHSLDASGADCTLERFLITHWLVEIKFSLIRVL